MSFWLGAMQGLSDWRAQEADRNLQQEALKRQGEEKVALTLLESDDPEVQMAGLTILQAAMGTPQRKKGVRGSLGEYETTAGLEPILALANRFKGLAGGAGGGMGAGEAPSGPSAPSPMTSPGAAALPASSPVEPKAQAGPNPWLFQGQPSNVTPPMFGDVPLSPVLNAPQQFAADASMAHPSGAINMGQIAGRVSRDKGQPRPGERGKLFWPTRASQAASIERAKFDTQIQTLQALGATPQQILSAVMASQGMPQGAPVTSGEEWVIVPGQTDPVLAFHYRNPTTGQAFMAYTGPSGQPEPLPAGTTRAPSMARAGAAGGASLTTYMTQEQMLAAGIVSPDDNWPPGLYKVQQKGDQYFVLPYQPPSPPAAAVGAGTSPRSGARMIMDRAGNVSEVPGTAPQINPRITAAKSLMAAVREQERISGLGTDIATLRQQVDALVRSGRYPALAGLTFEQIAQMEKLDEMTSDEMLAPVLNLVPTAPPGAGGTGAIGTPPVPASPTGPRAPKVPQGDDWGQRLADRILREQQNRMSQPGVVQGRGLPR